MAGASRTPGAGRSQARIAIAAGGTAGHVIPALAVADALSADGAHVEFVGGERAERELVPAAGYPFHALAIAGIDRRNPLRAARALALAARATATARRLLRALRIDAVIGGGGYAAGPVGLAARTLGLPLLLCEADSHLGLANRMLAPLAQRVCLAFPLAERVGPKYVVTGRAVPSTSVAPDRGRARERFGIAADATCVLVFGGSLGARSLNEAAVEAFAEHASFAVLHTSGKRDFEWLRERLGRAGSPPHYHLHAYVEPFGDALGAADLAAARAGGSVFELASAGLPAVLVPYPHATADHQAGNARWMADGGAAVVIPDGELTPARLARDVRALVADRERRATMAAAARSLARPDAARGIAAEALALARGEGVVSAFQSSGQ